MVAVVGEIAVEVVRLIAQILAPLLEDLISGTGRLALGLIGVKRRAEATVCTVVGGVLWGGIGIAAIMLFVGSE